MPLDDSINTPSEPDRRLGSYKGSPLSTSLFEPSTPGYSQMPSSRYKQRDRYAGPHRSDSEYNTDGQGAHGEDDSGSDRLRTPTRKKGVNRQGANATIHSKAGSLSPANLKKANRHSRGPRIHDRQRSSPLVNSEDRPSDSVGYAGSGREDTLSPDRPVSTPIKAAYAAPTFSASPAPSALPIPKLLSKSVPNSVVQGSMQAMLGEGSPKESQTPLSREVSRVKDEAPKREASPLDIFFRADREEKARAKSIGLDPAIPQSAADYSSPSAPSQRPRYSHVRNLTDTSPPDMFSMEMDGVHPSEGQKDYRGHPPSHERIPVFRSHTVPAAATGHEGENEERRAQSKALKDMLGIVSR